MSELTRETIQLMRYAVENGEDLHPDDAEGLLDMADELGRLREILRPLEVALAGAEHRWGMRAVEGEPDRLPDDMSVTVTFDAGELREALRNGADQ